jgi:hypothetical protein
MPKSLSPMWNSLDLCCFLSSFIQRSRYCLQIYMSTLLNLFSRVFSIPTKTELHPSPPPQSLSYFCRAELAWSPFSKK